MNICGTVASMPSLSQGAPLHCRFAETLPWWPVLEPELTGISFSKDRSCGRYIPYQSGISAGCCSELKVKISECQLEQLYSSEHSPCSGCTSTLMFLANSAGRFTQGAGAVAFAGPCSYNNLMKCETLSMRSERHSSCAQESHCCS